MFDLLRDQLDRMAGEDRAVSLFFRDDDAGRESDSLQRVMEAFIFYEVPLNIAVVPAWLKPAEASRLVDLKRRWPDLLCYHQHGYRHVNHAGPGKRSEFPDLRPYEAQLNDVRTGMEMLRSEMGEAFFSAFTPPWNRCSESTVEALTVLGFRLISRDAPTPGARERGLMDAPVTLDILERKNASRWHLRDPEIIVRELVEQLCSLGCVGVMLHHQHHEGESLAFLKGLLNILGGSPAVRCISFERMKRDAAP